jgi:hypothetical protein
MGGWDGKWMGKIRMDEEKLISAEMGVKSAEYLGGAKI